MFLQIGFYIFLAIALTFVVGGCALSSIAFFEYLEPYFTNIAMGFLAFCIVGILLMALLRFIIAGKNEASRKVARSAAMVLALPVVTAAVGIAFIVAYSIPGWRLPASANRSIDHIPNGDYATFQVDGQLYAYDFSNSELMNWKTTVVNDHNEIVTKSDFFHYGRIIVGRDGKEFNMQFQEDHYASDVFIPPDAQRVFYEIQYTKDNNGIWYGKIEDATAAEKYSPFGRDLFWTHDTKWTFLCSGQGLHKYDLQGAGKLIVESPEDYRVDDPVFSPDESLIAYALSSKNRRSLSKLCVATPAGEVTELFVTEEGAEISKPAWSSDGKKIAFRYQTRSKSSHPVRTLAITTLASKETIVTRQFNTGILLTPAGVADFAWSPDNRKIVMLASLRGATFLMNEGGTVNHKFDLYAMNADGTDIRRLTKLKQKWAGSSSGVPLIWWMND